MLKSTIISVAIILSSNGAVAADTQEVKQLNKAKISMAEAVQKAERQNGGYAIEASLDEEAANPVFEVSVVKNKITQNVKIDAVSGEVID